MDLPFPPEWTVNDIAGPEGTYVNDVCPPFLLFQNFFCAHFDHPTIITCEKAVYVYTQLCIINHAAYVYGSNIYGGKYVGLVVNFRVNPRENTENSVNKRLLAIKPARPCYSFLYRLLDS